MEREVSISLCLKIDRLNIEIMFKTTIVFVLISACLYSCQTCPIKQNSLNDKNNYDCYSSYDFFSMSGVNKVAGNSKLKSKVYIRNSEKSNALILINGKQNVIFNRGETRRFLFFETKFRFLSKCGDIKDTIHYDKLDRNKFVISRTILDSFKVFYYFERDQLSKVKLKIYYCEYENCFDNISELLLDSSGCISSISKFGDYDIRINNENISNVSENQQIDTEWFFDPFLINRIYLETFRERKFSDLVISILKISWGENQSSLVKPYRSCAKISLAPSKTNL